MTLDDDFIRDLARYMQDQRNNAHRVLHGIQGLERMFLLRSDIQDLYAGLCDTRDGDCLKDTPMGRMLGQVQEAAVNASWIYLALRVSAGRWQYLRIHVDTMSPQRVDVSHFLRFKERLVTGDRQTDSWSLEVDFAPFYRGFPRMLEARSIGKGVKFLNRRLSSRLFEELGKGDQRLLDFLRAHSYRQEQLMLNETVRDVQGLRATLRAADDYLQGVEATADWNRAGTELRAMGFEPGWGRDVARMRETMQLLLDILEAPSPDHLEKFLARIPMIFSIVILSPHGWFGQSDVLGRSDTGGQVVYILDQVRALEQEMHRRLVDQGLEIEPQILVITRLIPESMGTGCDQRIEAVSGTRNARILRIPFYDHAGDVVPQWLSRFEVWPYLERFSVDAEPELQAELGGHPDLIIGNYTDGNLVASIMSRRMGVTQCNIAHALEKTRYLYSDLYWRDNEQSYHFSCQFTADLIAMNAADFIITSSYHEIAGTADSVGQYEAYGAYTLPGLYRVVHGIDVFDPRFNIVSPGADPAVYFPVTDSGRRLDHLHDEFETLLFGREPGQGIRGVLQERDRPILFAMARMEPIKNITGLLRWYGESAALQDEVNLVVVAGRIDPARAASPEEQAQIELMHRLIDEYDLEKRIRWLGLYLEKGFAGELYRVIADHGGAFVQPALFEAFGLTVIEAMSTGLPTFATRYGGPMEIIEDGVSGFHIDPNHGELAAQRMADFFVRCRKDPQQWQRVSQAALERVEERYTWKGYAERLMTLARVYGFWRYVSNLDRAEARRYLEMFYALQYRPRSRAMEPG